MSWWSAVAGVVGSAIGGLFGHKSTSDTNQNNWRIAQYQNEYNTRMYEKQKSDALAQWNRENAYNEEMYNKYSSPEAQMRQMVAAGINPRASSLGSYTYGNGAASMNMPSMPAAAQYDYKSPLAAFTELSMMVGSLADIQQAFAQVDKTKAETKAINVKSMLDNVLRMKYGDETTHAAEKHAIWRYLHGFEEVDGGYKFPDHSKARGSALRKYSSEADNVTAKASYQDALARAMQENVSIGIDASGSWETNLIKLFMRKYYRNTQQGY